MKKMAMTIKPMKSYKAPAYPTYGESRQDARLLERLPRRWGKGSPAASLIGTGIMIQIAGAGRGDDAQGNEAKAAIVERAGQERKTVADAARALPVTRVAPILEEALANDGRGGFGCIAVSAPVFLSESEAIDLIEAELKKTGLEWKDIVTVDGLQVPEKDDWASRGEMKKNQLQKLKTGPYTFDLGTADKSVVVKFLQMKDQAAWVGRESSTVQSFDLATLATQVGEAFRQRTDGKPVIIGLFFDPLTYPEKGRLTRTRDNYEQVEKETKERAREKLRLQVRHFAEYLKQEGELTIEN